MWLRPTLYATANLSFNSYVIGSRHLRAGEDPAFSFAHNQKLDTRLRGYDDELNVRAKFKGRNSLFSLTLIEYIFKAQETIMSDIRKELKYLSSHEWARVEEDGTVTIGITDHAQDALGDVVQHLRQAPAVRHAGLLRGGLFVLVAQA